MPGKYRKGTGTCDPNSCHTTNNCWGTGTQGLEKYKHFTQVTSIDCNHNQQGEYYQLGPKQECLKPWLKINTGTMLPV